MVRAIIIGFGIAVLAFPSPAVAQTVLLTADKTAIIKDRCRNSQLVLDQVHKRDAVSRINYGRAYDNMLQQISAFNARLAYNKVNAPDLIQSASDLKGAVERFRASYDVRYGPGISDAVDIDCREKPEEFYAAVERARQDRLTLASDVAKVNEIIVSYRAQLVELQQNTLSQTAPEGQ